MRHRFFLVFFFFLAGLVTIGILFGVRAFPSHARFQMVVSWQYAFVGALAATAIVGFFRKFRNRLLWETLFLTTLFLGVWYAMLLILPVGVALLLAAALTLAQVFVRIVAVHNLFYLVGGAGVAINVAGLFSPEILVASLVAFTIYDTVAGPPGGPIEALAAFLIHKGIIPGLILPSRGRELFASIDEVVRGRAVLLGAGDLILPLTLVARAGFRDLVPAFVVLAGLLVGAGALAIQGRRSGQSARHLHPRAALPLLATGAAIPFLLFRFFARI